MSDLPMPGRPLMIGGKWLVIQKLKNVANSAGFIIVSLDVEKKAGRFLPPPRC
jgi:hypothetical protein